MRVTSRGFLLGAAGLIFLSYWGFFVPAHWAGWSPYRRAYYLRSLPVLVGAVMFLIIIAIKKRRDRNDER
jgi:hypothetical protein